MPNWCNNDYTFTGKEEEIIDFHGKLISFISKKRLPNDFGNSWLGNIVDGFGLDWNKIPCRGQIDYISDVGEDCNENQFSISTHSLDLYE